MPGSPIRNATLTIMLLCMMHSVICFCKEPLPKEIIGFAGIIKHDVKGTKRFGCNKRLLKAGTLVAFGRAGEDDWRVTDEKDGLIRVTYREKNSDVHYYCTWVPKEAVAQFTFKCDPNEVLQRRGIYGYPWLMHPPILKWVWNEDLLREARLLAAQLNVELISEVPHA